MDLSDAELELVAAGKTVVQFVPPLHRAVQVRTIKAVERQTREVQR